MPQLRLLSAFVFLPTSPRPLGFVRTLSPLLSILVICLIISSLPLLVLLLSLFPPSTVVFRLIKLDFRVGGISVVFSNR